MPPIEAIHPPTRGLLFFALLWNEEDLSIDETLPNVLGGHYLEKERFFPSYFPMKEYYSKEMGEALNRVLILVDGIHDRNEIVRAKKHSMEVEGSFLKEGKRKVNIDPGMIFLEQSLLISTKPYAHRVFIEDNLYIELNHIYENKTFTHLKWTYPDYREKDLIDQFVKWRKLINI